MNIDYSKYTEDQLYDSLASINKEKYPDNYKKIHIALEKFKVNINEQEPLNLTKDHQYPIKKKVLRVNR